MLRLVSAVAFAGFVVSLAVHGATYAGINLSEQFGWVWGLHILIFPLFIPMLFLFRARGTEGRNALQSFFAPMPKWVKYAFFALAAYTVINFLFFFYGAGGGSPDIRDGKYVLHNHGKIIRELTAEEYSHYQTRTLRGFSGHWLYFYFVMGAFYLFPPRKAQEQSDRV